MADELLSYARTMQGTTVSRRPEVRVENAVNAESRKSESRELMKTSNLLRRVYGAVAVLIGVLFFFIIVGVFGLPLAIAGLAVFVLGAVVVCRVFPTESAR
jgi:VIT1/CCC1 family predicted Fe2+/Mn2+ transporter